MNMGMSGESNGTSDLRVIPWSEMEKHATRDDCWIAVDGKVYDVSRWQRKHPGGARIINNFGGQDATDAFYAMHPELTLVKKNMKPLLVGQTEKPLTDSEDVQMMLEFRELRASLEQRGMFKASPTFFTLHLAHIIILEIFAYYYLLQSGGGLLAFCITAAILAVSQAQAGWTQHDYGHLSVFPSNKINHMFHHLTIGIIKSASSHWWNFSHSLHHTKPNVFKKDPDITLPHVFMLGDKIPVKWGHQKRGKMPFQQQHRYFWLVGPIGLLTVLFFIENLIFVLKRRDWVDMLMMFLYFSRFDYLFGGYYDTRWKSLALYMAMRVLDGAWFVFVTQMNHVPMDIDEDQNNNWLTQQTIASCNIEPSLFNDWFTGHLNYQIEHHLFPTMPRHNLCKVSAEVQALCKKYNRPYIVKPLSTAFGDILISLKHSGDLWHKAYYAN